MESLKEIVKAKVSSILAILIVGAYLGLYYFRDVTQLPMDTLNNILMLVVGYYFRVITEDKKKE